MGQIYISAFDALNGINITTKINLHSQINNAPVLKFIHFKFYDFWRFNLYDFVRIKIKLIFI